MRIMMLGLFLGLLLAGCGGEESTPEPADNEPEDAAQTAEAEGAGEEDKRRARQLVDSAIAASGDYDNTRAEQHLRRALELYPDFGLAHAWLGRVLNNLGRYDEALEHHLRAAELTDEPELRREQRYAASRVCFDLAGKAMDAGDYEAAEKHVNRMLDLGRESYAALSRLGVVLHKQEKYDEAIDAWRRAAGIESGARAHGAMFQVGRIHHEREEYEKAEEIFTGLIRRDFTGNDVYAWRAHCRYVRGDLEGARDDYAQAERHAQSDENARLYAERMGALTRELSSDE